MLVAFVQAATKEYEELYIVTPLASGGDMEAWLTSKEIPSSPPKLDDPTWSRGFLLESIISIVEAVAYCHSEINGEWCGHYDIKPRNILLFQSEGRWLWKLGDFGLSTIKRVCDIGNKDDVGTNEYHPPEYYKNPRNHQYGPSFDVFSTGCVVLQLATLLVFPWKQNMITALKTELAQLSKGFAFRNSGKDWSDRVMRRTKDEQIHSLLKTALQMMNQKTQERLLAFDAALDLIEIATPQINLSSYEQCCERLVQGQALSYRFSPCYKPIARAISSSRAENRAFRLTRIKHLRREGWADVPVNTHYSDGGYFTNMPPSFDTEAFYGRGNDLRKIESLFALTRTVSLYGTGGVGKSHLAWKYVKDAQERAATEGTTLHTFWIQARNSSTITTSYESIAEAIGMMGSDGSYSEKAVLRWLKGRSKGPWILVLDGVTVSCNEWRKRCPFKYGQILITTRDQDLGNGLCASPSFGSLVDPLGIEDNVKLLFTMMSQPLAEDYDFARNLVMKLQLPIIIKIMARTIDSGMRAGSNVRTMEEALKERPAFARKLEELDINDPCSDDLLPSVNDIFDMLFEAFEKESRVYGCNDKKCLSGITKTSCRTCKRIINHSIEVLRLMCFFSRTHIEKRLIEAEAASETCRDLTEKAFVVLTSFCYIKRSSSTISQQYDIHDLVYTMFQSWYEKGFSGGKGLERHWNGRLRALGMLLNDYKQERQKIDRDCNSTGIPLSLLKLRYRDHIEEFVQYIQEGKPFQGQLKVHAAESILTFARVFNEENRFDMSQYLLRFTIDRGIENDTKRQIELHARIELVSSMEQSTKGRRIGSKLEQLLTDINDIKKSVKDVGNPNRLLRLCIDQQVNVLLRLRMYSEATTTLQELKCEEPEMTVESKKRRLTVLRLQALCLHEHGISQCDFGKLDQSRKLWCELIQAIPDSPYGAVDRAERVEGAEKNHADTTLLLVEKAHSRKSTPMDFDAEDLSSSVYKFYEQFLRKKQSQFSDQGREHLDHRDVVEAEREFVIANLRIGLWENDIDKIEDAVESLNDILAKYETMGLDIRDQATRNSAYRRQEGLSFLISHGAPHYEKDLKLVTEKYELLNVPLKPHGWLGRLNSTVARQVQIRPEKFFGDSKSAFVDSLKL